MNTIQIVTASGHDQVQLVVGGLVPEVQLAGATFEFTTAWVVEGVQAHRPRAASEPRPLVGECELKRKALRREIDELEAAHRIAFDDWYMSEPGSRDEDQFNVTRKTLARRLNAKRDELVALAKCGPTDREPSPTNAGDERLREREETP